MNKSMCVLFWLSILDPRSSSDMVRRGDIVTMESLDTRDEFGFSDLS